MNRVRVKICGIRTLKEAEAAVEMGADALGFNFWPRSPRYIEQEAARNIVSKLSPLVSNIGVFVNESRQIVESTARELGLAAVQLHGDESREYCAAILGAKTIRAFRVTADFDPNSVKGYPAHQILLDTGVDAGYGGTGRTFDWSVAAECARIRPIILAGGLRAENVAEAIAMVRPAGIDVCSGVESVPGRKDLNKLRALMLEVAKSNASLRLV